MVWIPNSNFELDAAALVELHKNDEIRQLKKQNRAISIEIKSLKILKSKLKKKQKRVSK